MTFVKEREQLLVRIKIPYIMSPSHFPALARGITLVESSHKASSAQSRQLVNSLMIHCKQKAAQQGKTSLAFRIGLSGPPGAGKSTFTGDKVPSSSKKDVVTYIRTVDLVYLYH